MGEAIENEKEVFAGKLDDECKTIVVLVGTNKYSDQSGWRSSFSHQDGCLVRGVLGNDVVKIRVEEGSVFAVGMDGESLEVQEGDEMKARVEKELFLPSGWKASPGRCRWRT